ncbi:MAG: hypothetical protein JNM84_27290 [Planctomycetes bacterium]|nr:hypothetical protein [Planctomycetota bacterium]
MSEPLPYRPPSAREAWVEAQVWRRCVEARKAGDDGASGGSRLLDREAGEAELRALISLSREHELAGLAESELEGEDQRLLSMARGAVLLSALPMRRAPAALDAVLEELEDLEPEVEDDEAGFSPDLLASFQREETTVRELMAQLSPRSAPAALDAHFEAELARYQRTASSLAPVVANASSADSPSGSDFSLNTFSANTLSLDSGRGTTGSSQPGSERTRLRVVWRQRLAWAAAAVLLGAIGVAIFWRAGAAGGAGGDDPGGRVASRFSFRYVDVETAGADVANRPALRLLRGWASHISPDALESSSAPK